MLISREEYMEKFRRLKDKDIIKVITGIRRSGKSTLLKMFAQELKDNGIKDENIILINFDKKKYRNINNIDKLDNTIYELTKDLAGKIYLLLDEIQNVKDWEIAINSYMLDFNSDIYITGSNSQLLSGEFATKLTGRTMEINVHPLSFKEFYNHNKTETKQENLEKELLFNEYYRYGGMPFIYKISNEDREEYIHSIINSILFKDILSRYEIRDTLILEKLIEYIGDNTGNIFSSNSIHDYFKNEGINISSKTIYNYLTYLNQAYLINRVKREDIKSKKILKLNEKYYFTDHSFINMGEKTEISGSVIENIVYMELLRRGYTITVGKEDKYEIDFVCKKKNKTRYVQVAKSLENNPKAKLREFRPLKRIKNNNHKYVITKDNFDFSQDGIEHYDIIEFLLSNEILP